jgi:hypothetical protein
MADKEALTNSFMSGIKDKIVVITRASSGIGEGSKCGVRNAEGGTN